MEGGVRVRGALRPSAFVHWSPLAAMHPPSFDETRGMAGLFRKDIGS
jgi:hypothetical protein